MSVKTAGRISVLKEEGLFSLVIFPQKNKLKLNLLFGWWILWSLCGVIFITTLINYSGASKWAEIEYNTRMAQAQTEKERQTIISEIKGKLEKNQQQRLILMVIIGFWAYYEFKVGRAYFFRKFGYEKIWMKNGKIFYKREINKRGRVRSFDAEYVKEFKILEYNKHDFFQNMSRSFWTLSGESLSFDYHSKTMRFGIQLEEQEARETCDRLNRALRALKKAEQ